MVAEKEGQRCCRNMNSAPIFPVHPAGKETHGCPVERHVRTTPLTSVCMLRRRVWRRRRPLQRITIFSGEGEVEGVRHEVELVSEGRPGGLRRLSVQGEQFAAVRAADGDVVPAERRRLNPELEPVVVHVPCGVPPHGGVYQRSRDGGGAASGAGDRPQHCLPHFFGAPEGLYPVRGTTPRFSVGAGMLKLSSLRGILREIGGYGGDDDADVELAVRTRRPEGYGGLAHAAAAAAAARDGVHQRRGRVKLPLQLRPLRCSVQQRLVSDPVGGIRELCKKLSD